MRAMAPPEKRPFRISAELQAAKLTRAVLSERQFEEVMTDFWFNHFLTMSEFGRTVRENGNRGTDHGHATAMLVLGGPVKGGRMAGMWPGLAPEQLYEGRDLAVTTDFRDLFAEVALRHLGVMATAPLFPGFTMNPLKSPGVLV